MFLLLYHAYKTVQEDDRTHKKRPPVQGIESRKRMLYLMIAKVSQVGQLSLTVGKSLMYYPQVEVLYLLQGIYGRLLKLVDRADLGSVGASHESSSLSPPTFFSSSDLNCLHWILYNREYYAFWRKCEGHGRKIAGERSAL